MRVMISLLVFGYIVLSTATIHAQDYQYTCSDLTNTINLSRLCDDFSTCNDLDVNCIQEGVVSILPICFGVGLSNCEARSTLYWIVNHHIQWDGINLFHPDGFQPSLLATVSAFDAGDYETAILEFEDITQSEDYAPYFTLEIAHGLLYYANEDYDQAFIHFDNSINGTRHIGQWERIISEFDNPLSYYFRGLIYRQWGNEDRALQDFYTYDALVTDQLKARLPLNSFRLTLDNPQTYMMYPVLNGFTHLYGFGYRDLTFADSEDIVVSYQNNDEILVISGSFERRSENTPEFLFLEQDPDNPTNYYLNLNAPDIHDAKPDTYHLKVTVHPTYLEYYETVWHLDGSSTRVGILLPTSEEDIRSISPRRVCDDSPLSFINVDDMIDMVSYSEEITLIDDPLIDHGLLMFEHDDFGESSFVVIDGPVCFDGNVWWQVYNGTNTGWFVEADEWREDLRWNDMSSVYQIMPRDLFALWQTENQVGLTAGIPTPLEFLGVTIENE